MMQKTPTETRSRDSSSKSKHPYAASRNRISKSSSSTSSRLGEGSKSSESTTKADILISIKPVFMNHIVQRTKNHEFRKYLISNTVKRMWLYVSSPDQTLRYVATISHGKLPGEIEDEVGMGNADFNNGIKESKYGYEIKELYQLNEPIVLKEMQQRYGTTYPQRFIYVPEKMIEDVVLEDQIRLF